MTAAFALLVAGFILLDAGWKGVTPAAVLRGVAGGGGPGGVLAQAGGGLTSSLTGNEPEGIQKLPKKLKGKLGRKGEVLARNHPELKPGIIAITSIVLVTFPGLKITATTNGDHVEGSYHYQGRAVDLAGTEKEMNRAAKWINTYLSSVLTEGIHNPGLSVDSKKHVASSFWGGVWEEHRDHIHLAV